MKIPKTSSIIEGIVLVIFCTAFLWFAASNILENQVKHDYPFGYMANDAIQNYGIAEGIKEQGHYFYQPMSVAGGYKDVVGTHYPIIYHISVLNYFGSGIKMYDSLMFMVIILLLIASLMMYAIIRNMSRDVAIISLPLMLLVSYATFSSGITWGQHGSLTAGLFLVSVIWALSKFDLNAPFFIIIFLSASFFGHPSVFVYSAFFMGIYCVIRLLKKDFKFKEIKALTIIGVIAFIIMFYYLIIFKFAWVSATYLLDVLTDSEFITARAFPAVLLQNDFNIFILVPMIIGFVVSILFFLKKRTTIVVAFVFLLWVGLSNYFGFTTRAFQQRYLWPIYLSAFFGLGIYFVFKSLFKRINILYSSAIFLVIIIAMLVGHSGKTNAGSMMDPYHWESFDWIRENIDTDTPVHFFYQDIGFQRATYYSSAQRKSYIVEIDKFAEDLNEGKIKRYYQMTISSEAGADLPYRETFFSYGYHLPELMESLKEKMDICSMEYIVFDKLSRQQPLADYNVAIMNNMLKNDWINEVYSNPVVSIIKNNKPGEDCIAE